VKQAVVAGGCFWGVEELIRQVPGIIDTEVGYTGGQTQAPTYETVKTGRTGHAEAVRITYDANKVSYRQMLEMFFRLHDPTTVDRQGNDTGSQYRSAIFVSDSEEERVARETIAAEEASGRWSRPVVTKVEPLKEFFPAESYHQDYLQKNPGGYNCHYWRE
jgi:methionine-S-sulfoxide reductase